MSSQPKTAFDLRPSDPYLEEIDALVQKFSEMTLEEPENKEPEKTVTETILQGYLVIDALATITSFFY